MKKKILTITLIADVAVGSFILGTTQAKTETETIKPDIYSYIECDSFETFEVVNENELHIIANYGNEYVFSK